MNRLLFVIAASIALATCATAQTNIAPWKTTVSAGGALTSGNSKSSKANASVLEEGEKPSLGSIRAGAELNYGSSTVKEKKTTDLDNAKAAANAKKTLTPLSFAYGDLSFMHDTVADLDYRVSAGPGGGFYAVKNHITTLALEAGPSHVWEKKGGLYDSYWALRMAERLDIAVSETAKLWEALEYEPQVDKFSNYLMTAEVGIEAAITSRLGLRLVLEDKYDSEPAVGLKSNDLSLLGGLSIKL